MANIERKTILVSGATGRQGGAVARHLLDAGWHVRAMTRNPAQGAAVELASLGAEVVAGDLDRPQSLAPVIEGAYGVFSVQNFWGNGFDREVAQGKALADAALAAGVTHFVYSSAGGTGRVDGLGIRHLDSKTVIERYINNIGLSYTIFGPVTFYENFSATNYVKAMIDDGLFTVPIDGGKDFQMVAIQDLAAFVVLAFADPATFMDRKLELASDFFTLEAFAAVIGRRIGRPVRFRRLPDWRMWLAVNFIEIAGHAGKAGVGRSTYNQLRWNNASAFGGWDADLKELRALYPGLTRMEDWVAGVDWHGIRGKLGG